MNVSDTRIKVLGVIADSGFYLKQFIERLEEEHLTYIIAVRLIRPLQRQIYSPSRLERDRERACLYRSSPLCIPSGERRDGTLWSGRISSGERRRWGRPCLFLPMRLTSKTTAYSAWITNSKERPYEVWTMCKPRANDENTIKELKEDFALAASR